VQKVDSWKTFSWLGYGLIHWLEAKSLVLLYSLLDHSQVVSHKKTEEDLYMFDYQFPLEKTVEILLLLNCRVLVRRLGVKPLYLLQNQIV